MDNKKKIIFVYGGFSFVIILIVFFLALFDVISWITFFILLLVMIVISVLSLFLYYIFVERKKEVNTEEEKKILTEEECESQCEKFIGDAYTDYIKQIKDKGTRHYGEENTPIYLYHCEGEWGVYNKKFYIILINMVNGSRRTINYDVKKMSGDEIDSLILKTGEGLSSRPRKDTRYKEIHDMGPVPGMERIIKEPIQEKNENEKKEKEEGGLE